LIDDGQIWSRSRCKIYKGKKGKGENNYFNFAVNKYAEGKTREKSGEIINLVIFTHNLSLK
jgi:hypothetical protein